MLEAVMADSRMVTDHAWALEQRGWILDPKSSQQIDECS